MELFSEIKPTLVAYMSAIGTSSVPIRLKTEAVNTSSDSVLNCYIYLLNFGVVSFGSFQAEEIERLWSGFVLYCVKKLNSEKAKQDCEEGGFTLPRILRAAKLKYRLSQPIYA